MVRRPRGGPRATMGSMVCLCPNLSRWMNALHSSRPHFYFALPRLIATMRGADSRRAENNGTEATAGSIAIYLINYLFFAQFVPATLPLWQTALWLGGNVF